MSALTLKLSEMRVLEQALDRSLRDGRRWLQDQMIKGGRVRGDRDVNSFGKPLWGLWSAGASRPVLKTLLDHLAAKAVRPNGDLAFP
jgi:hypothetical protein